jgi:hypothetical protein
MQESADQAVAAGAVVIAATRPVAVVGKMLEHEIEQLHRLGDLAFPDEFNAGLRRFRDRIKRSEGKATADGHVIDAVAEIRVQASPNWAADRATVFFLVFARTREDL